MTYRQYFNLFYFRGHYNFPNMRKFMRNKRVNAGMLSQKLKGIQNQLKFFQRIGIIPKKVKCQKCDVDMTSTSVKYKQFRCNKCKGSQSWFKDTFMAGAKISMRKVIMLGESTFITGKPISFILCFLSLLLLCASSYDTAECHSRGG